MLAQRVIAGITIDLQPQIRDRRRVRYGDVAREGVVGAALHEDRIMVDLLRRRIGCSGEDGDVSAALRGILSGKRSRVRQVDPPCCPVLKPAVGQQLIAGGLTGANQQEGGDQPGGEEP